MDSFISSLLKCSSEGNFSQLAADFLPYYSLSISKAGGMLSAETLEDIKKALLKGNLNVVVDQIQAALSASEDAFLEVAVIGESGTGKSSLINALRGLGHDDEGSASVGVVEMTMEKTPYQHPKYPKVTFWDLPGTGTPTFAPDTYLERVGFANYDFFLIISASRFTLNDAVLAQKIKEAGKNFYFVRTKVDSDLYNEKKTRPTSFNKERVLQQIRDYCVASLSAIQMPDARVFLISNFDVDAFDFPRLEETLLKELPAHKRHAFALLLPNFSNAAIELKKAFLKEKIWLEALKWSVLSVLPLMPIFNGFDLEKQERCLETYRSCFGLDDKSVEEIAKKLNTSVQDLKNEIKCMDFWSLVKDDSLTARVAHCVECFTAVKGGPASSAVQGFKVYFLHLKFLDVVADDAKTILRKMR